MSKTGTLSASGGISENEKRAHEAFSLTLDECGNGITPANVKASVTLMMNNLEKINPGEVKEKSSITLVGRKLSELVTKLMDAADPNVKTTIDLDYSLSTYARERRAVINQLEIDCEKKKKSREVLEEPDRQEHEDEAFVLLQRELKAWRIDEANKRTYVANPRALVRQHLKTKMKLRPSFNLVVQMRSRVIGLSSSKLRKMSTS